MLGTALETAKRILRKSPNYEIKLQERDSLKVYLRKPTQIRGLRGSVVYRWHLFDEDIVIRCHLPDNKDAFDAGKTFRAMVRVGGEKYGTCTIEKI